MQVITFTGFSLIIGGSGTVLPLGIQSDIMKALCILLLLLLTASLHAQNFVTAQGEYMDTTKSISANCAPPYKLFYYQLKAKYPVSSAILLRESNAFLKQKGGEYTGSGYVTFRFFIDCEGTMSRVLVMQTDENYKTIHFDKAFVNDLYQYLKTMDQWKKNIDIQDIKNANYIAYISFKIKNGEVVNIIP